MQRYFFDLIEFETILDEEGMLLPDADAAHRHAVSARCSILQDVARERSRSGLIIRVRDAQGFEVHRVRFMCEVQEAA
jgi:hypothetical protein